MEAEKLLKLVEKYESLIYETADHIWKHPETGYREWKTSAYIEEQFEKLGYTLVRAGNIPGFSISSGRFQDLIQPFSYEPCLPAFFFMVLL